MYWLRIFRIPQRSNSGWSDWPTSRKPQFFGVSIYMFKTPVQMQKKMLLLQQTFKTNKHSEAQSHPASSAQKAAQRKQDTKIYFKNPPIYGKD
jgi:hypothetical protein